MWMVKMIGHLLCGHPTGTGGMTATRGIIGKCGGRILSTAPRRRQMSNKVMETASNASSV